MVVKRKDLFHHYRDHRSLPSVACPPASVAIEHSSACYARLQDRLGIHPAPPSVKNPQWMRSTQINPQHIKAWGLWDRQRARKLTRECIRDVNTQPIVTS